MGKEKREKITKEETVQSKTNFMILENKSIKRGQKNRTELESTLSTKEWLHKVCERSLIREPQI